MFSPLLLQLLNNEFYRHVPTSAFSPTELILVRILCWIVVDSRKQDAKNSLTVVQNILAICPASTEDISQKSR